MRALNPLQFGANVDPATDGLPLAFRVAEFADQNGFDMVTIQDHPYNRRHVDTWTLLTAIGVKTKRVKVGTNVTNLPLRPPVMLAKSAATLDVLTDGRVELGLGAGALWPGVVAMGGEERSSGEAFRAFDEALHLMKGLWANAGRPFTYEGETYQVRGALFGPKPVRGTIPVWVGGAGPKMMNLTGRMADGLWLSSTYHQPSALPHFFTQVDDGADQAGRNPADIRRGYNLMGIVDYGQFGAKPAGLQEGVIYGSPHDWVDLLVQIATEYGADTFNFWPLASDDNDHIAQLQAFAQDVMLGVKSAVDGEKAGK